MPPDLHSLAARAEAADPSEQREVLNAAFRAIHGEKPTRVLGGSDALTNWLLRYNPFFKMLDAEAYESAALTLVPEGWAVLLAFSEQRAVCDVHSKPLGQHGTWPGHANAATPALALVAACLKARATQGENDAHR
jgi:hypothetical protein